MKLLRAFLIRDFYTETSYRVSFLLGIGSTLFRVLIFHFLSRLVGDSAAPALQEYDGDYFSFVIIGIAFGGYFGIGLTGFAQALRQAQTTGTLEAMLVTPAPVSWIIIGSAAWSYTSTTFRVLVYLLAGTLVFGLDLSNANFAAAAVILILSIISFASIGIVIASFIMVIKRGDPLTTLISNLATLIGGVFYPVEVLPGWLQSVARLLPITYSLRAMRLALLTGASWPELASDLFALSAFCLSLFPLSLLLFRRAVDHARTDGTLAHY